MDKNQTNNKIGEIFEKQLPNEQVPAFIRDNISEALDASTTTEDTGKIKNSFEEGGDNEVLPAFIWSDIQGELDATATLEADWAISNKIKTSFEGKYQDDLPSNLWINVEEQLEIETVWHRVYQALNSRTRKRYWQEKGMQLGIVAMAILGLRGCGIGDGLLIRPIATEFSQPKVELLETTTNAISASRALSEKNSVNTSVEHKIVKEKIDTDVIQNPLLSDL